MRELHIDIETYSDEDLTRVGVYKYVESPAFEILIFGYAFDDEPVTVINCTADRLWLQKVRDWIRDPAILKTAHNASFERVCLSKVMFQTLDPRQWFCTAVLASTLGLPRSLDQATKVLGFDEDQRKSSAGKSLIRYFSIPCAPTLRNGGRTRNLPRHDPAKWELYLQYNGQDVVAERALMNKLRCFPIPAEERLLYILDQEINDRGMYTDELLIRNAIEASTAIEERSLEEAIQLTGLDNPRSVAQLKGWLLEVDDTEVPSLNKQSVPALIANTDNEAVKRVLGLRSEMAKASVKKYLAIRRAVNGDNRLRGTLMFYGARTGRWAGRIFQPQNLPQNKLPDLALAREMVKAGDYEGIEMLFGTVSGTLSQLVRTALIPRPGCRFIVADFSAIEARVIAWYAKEKWRMEVFNTHGKIYEASASQMFKVPLESIAKGQENYKLRAKGKVSELALGYGGGTGALTAMGALDMGLTKEELPGLVKAWRAASPGITQFWWDVGDAAFEAVTTGLPQETHGLIFGMEHGFLFIRLPSGRRIAYAKPRIMPGQHGKPTIVYNGIEGTKKVWGPIETYGPRLVENIVQATARDLLAYGLLNLDAAGYPVCFHVHDEAIAETSTGSLEEMIQLLTNKPAWANGLPLTADGYECDFYRKE